MCFDHFDTDVQCEETYRGGLWDNLTEEEYLQEERDIARVRFDEEVNERIERMGWEASMQDESDRIADDMNHQHFNGEI